MNDKEDAKQEASLTFKKRFRVQVQKHWKYTRKWFPFAIFVGAISGVIMSFFTSLIFIVQRLIIDSPTALQYLLYPVVGGITSLFMFFGFKEVYGAGLSNVLAHKNTTTSLRPRGILTKFFTSFITLGIGAPGGREGPAVTIGSTASSVIGNKVGMTQEDEMHAITIGAAACTAAVFRAPLGGTVFAAEVPYKRDLDETVFLPALVASAISYLVYDSILVLFFGTESRGFFSIGLPSSFDFSLDFINSLHFLLLGIMAGFLGVGFSLLFKFFPRWIERFLKTYWLPLIGMGMTAVIVFLIDELYLPAGVKVAGTGFESINNLINNVVTIEIGILFALLLGKILVTSTCVGFGNSAGIMGPTLVTGAALGLLYSLLFPAANSVALIVVGMSAMHTATTKTPIASMILVLEMVGFPNLVIPIILSNAMAFIISMDFSLYKGQIQSKEVILRRRIQYTDLLETLTVKEAMEKTYPSAKSTDLLSESFSLLYLYKTSALLVIDEDNNLEGIISAVDFQRGFAKGKGYVEDVMTKDVIMAYPEETLTTAFDKLTKFRIESMPVVERENNKVILGIISFRDIENRYETALTKLQSRRELTIEEIEDDI
ncbi:MAG: chloride channel protein [Asgard group archaeon]|nr:chloride channel protein [Asgard group archaeon]